MSNTILIIGGSGKVAKRLTVHLKKSSNPTYTVHSIIRSKAHVSSLEELGSVPHIHSIEETTVTDLTTKIREISPSAIVWAAGAGGGDPSRTKKVDQDGAITAFDAAAAAGVQRFLMVSAFDVRNRESKPVPDWYSDEDKAKSDKTWGAIGAYMQCKLNADENLRTGNDKRGLKYTIVRPSGLLDEQGHGTIAAGKVGLEKSISRDDVAAVLVECLANEGTIGLAFDITGGDTPISQAVKEVAEGKVDCFDGYF